MSIRTKAGLAVPALLLFVILPLAFLVFRGGVEALRTVDFVTIFAAGTAFGAAIVVAVAGRRAV